jgi:hypothetical protein
MGAPVRKSSASARSSGVKGKSSASSMNAMGERRLVRFFTVATPIRGKALGLLVGQGGRRLADPKVPGSGSTVASSSPESIG